MTNLFLEELLGCFGLVAASAKEDTHAVASDVVDADALEGPRDELPNRVDAHAALAECVALCRNGEEDVGLGANGDTVEPQAVHLDHTAIRIAVGAHEVDATAGPTRGAKRDLILYVDLARLEPARVGLVGGGDADELGAEEGADLDLLAHDVCAEQVVLLLAGSKAPLPSHEVGKASGMAARVVDVHGGTGEDFVVLVRGRAAMSLGDDGEVGGGALRHLGVERVPEDDERAVLGEKTRDVDEGGVDEVVGLHCSLDKPIPAEGDEEEGGAGKTTTIVEVGVVLDLGAVDDELNGDAKSRRTKRDAARTSAKRPRLVGQMRSTVSSNPVVLVVAPLVVRDGITGGVDADEVYLEGGEVDVGALGEGNSELERSLATGLVVEGDAVLHIFVLEDEVRDGDLDLGDVLGLLVEAVDGLFDLNA